MPMPSAAPTRAHRAWTDRTLRTSKRMGGAVAGRTGACAQGGDIPTGTDQTCVHTEGQRQTQAAGHLDRAKPGLHDGSDAGAGTDLRSRPSTRNLRLPRRAQRQHDYRHNPVEEHGSEPNGPHHQPRQRPLKPAHRPTSLPVGPGNLPLTRRLRWVTPSCLVIRFALGGATVGAAGRCQANGPGIGSFLTRRWRKTDSNPRSRLSRAARSAGSSQSVGRDWRRPGASSYVVAAPSGSLIQPVGIKHAASSSDISTMPSKPTVICRFDLVCTAPMPAGALTRT